MQRRASAPGEGPNDVIPALDSTTPYRSAGRPRPARVPTAAASRRRCQWTFQAAPGVRARRGSQHPGGSHSRPPGARQRRASAPGEGPNAEGTWIFLDGGRQRRASAPGEGPNTREGHGKEAPTWPQRRASAPGEGPNLPDGAVGAVELGGQRRASAPGEGPNVFSLPESPVSPSAAPGVRARRGSQRPDRRPRQAGRCWQRRASAPGEGPNWQAEPAEWATPVAAPGVRARRGSQPLFRLRCDPDP